MATTVCNIGDIAAQLTTASRIVVTTDFFWVYAGDGTQVKIPAEYVKAYLSSDLKASIKFQGGTTGIEVSTDGGKTWSEIAAYSDLDPDLAELAKQYETIIANEDERVEAETNRKANESARVTAETDRATAESERVKAESEREQSFTTAITNAESATSAANTAANSVNTAITNAEKATTAANTAASTANTAASNADTSRKAIEANEDTRKANESARQTAESERVTAESNRADAEATRESNEATRKSNESSRVTAESSRTSAEKTREANEDTRKSNESARVTAESERSTAETNRASAEKTRESNENTRKTQEQSRVDAEAARVKAESERVTAENNRASAEKERETNTSTAISNANTATTNANNAAEKATSAANSATSAASSATSAASAANSAATNANNAAEKAESLVNNQVGIEQQFTLELTSSPSFSILQSAAVDNYLAHMGGYMWKKSDGKWYAAKLNPSDWSKFTDGTAVDDASKYETMVHVPQCNYLGNENTLRFGGLTPINGGHTFGSPEWVGAYLMYVDGNGVAHSRPDVSPSHSRTMSSFWSCAQTLDTKAGLASYQFHCLINALYQAKYGNLNSQSTIGAGWQSNLWEACRDVNMGLTRSLGDGSGNVTYTDDTLGTQHPTKLFGFEDLWSKLWEFRPGIKFSYVDGVKTATVYEGNQVSNTATGRTFSVSSLNAGGSYVKSMVLGEYWDMIPDAVGAGDNTYYCDGYWDSTNGELLRVGGNAGNWSRCGLAFATSYNGFSFSWSALGARLAFYANPTIVSGSELVALA